MGTGLFISRAIIESKERVWAGLNGRHRAGRCISLPVSPAW